MWNTSKAFAHAADKEALGETCIHLLLLCVCPSALEKVDNGLVLCEERWRVELTRAWVVQSDLKVAGDCPPPFHAV